MKMRDKLKYLPNELKVLARNTPLRARKKLVDSYYDQEIVRGMLRGLAARFEVKKA